MQIHMPQVWQQRAALSAQSQMSLYIWLSRLHALVPTSIWYHMALHQGVPTIYKGNKVQYNCEHHYVYNATRVSIIFKINVWH